MNIWNKENFSSLTDAQRRAVESRAGEGESGPDYLNRIGAGVSAVDSYVEADKGANRAAMTEAADALFDAGVPAARIVPLATGFASAPEETRAKVIDLLT